MRDPKFQAIDQITGTKHLAWLVRFIEHVKLDTSHWSPDVAQRTGKPLRCTQITRLTGNAGNAEIQNFAKELHDLMNEFILKYTTPAFHLSDLEIQHIADFEQADLDHLEQVASHRLAIDREYNFNVEECEASSARWQEAERKALDCRRRVKIIGGEPTLLYREHAARLVQRRATEIRAEWRIAQSVVTHGQMAHSKRFA